ncbi:DNA translocase SpoIIIE [bacterium BMS3Abin07]|nr:DNA translocase SpoIIIE [bacterium BMS3Abin07]GBE31808.1 DNA translocase SpoIIIE [bacterium BMS3Bbin05]HDO21882.1 DNA translocase FtsK [Nitrospirota bacterium]HDZ87530.1 DNA translocase FtsK [Nitrospirota bacterium]
MAEGIKRKLQEILGITSILTGLYLLLILITYSRWDPSPFTESSQVIHNLGGIVGSYLSDMFFNLVGKSSYLFPVTLCIYGINRLMAKKRYRVKAVGFALLIVSLSIIASLINMTFKLNWEATTTGLTGVTIGSILIRLLSIPGAYIIALSLFFSAIILLIPVTVESMVKKMKEQDSKKSVLTKAQKKVRNAKQVNPVIKEPILSEPEPIKQPLRPAFDRLNEHGTGPYRLPSPVLLSKYDSHIEKPDRDHLLQMAETLEARLEEFNISGKITQVLSGPVITMFEFEPAAGIKINKVVSLSEDLGRAMGGISVRISPIPGKSPIGIEVPNLYRSIVSLRETLSSKAFCKAPSKLSMAVGVNIYGKPLIADLVNMPHLLVAGTTGSGKSVSLNSMIMSILYKASPLDVKILMIDPKLIELSAYENIPHLVHPVITHPREATDALRKMVFEMEKRYKIIAEQGAKNIDNYNRMVNDDRKLPYIVIVIDELADLMYTASKEAESAIVRLAQMARASGIHMIIATQRPSVDVITGIIKANFPTRIAFRVTSKVDSRTILDTNGAEHLLDKGDMLMLLPGARIVRLHGPFISEDEIKGVTDFIRAQQNPDYAMFDSLETEMVSVEQQKEDDDKDELYLKIIDYAESMGEISISSMQRKFKIGYNRAARIMDLLEEDALVGPVKGAGKPRDFIGRRNY